MLKKYIALLLIWNLAGCSSFGRGVAEAILDKDTEVDTRQCEIRGANLPVSNHIFPKAKPLKC